MSDTGSGLHNDAIVEAMHNVAIHDSPDRRAMFFQLLVESTLVVSTPDSARETSPTRVQEESLSIITLSEQSGLSFPVFTDAEALLRWRPQGSACVTIPATALFRMAAHASAERIVINPGSETTARIERSEIEDLAHGRLPIPIRAEPAPDTPKIGIGGALAPPPEAAIDAVREVLGAHRSVERAFSYVMVADDSEPVTAVAVCFAPGVSDSEVAVAMDEIIDAVARASEATHGWAFTAADLALEQALHRGSGREIFRR